MLLKRVKWEERPTLVQELLSTSLVLNDVSTQCGCQLKESYVLTKHNGAGFSQATQGGGIGMGWVKGGLLDNKAFSREGEGEVSRCIAGQARSPLITKGGCHKKIKVGDY